MPRALSQVTDTNAPLFATLGNSLLETRLGVVAGATAEFQVGAWIGSTLANSSVVSVDVPSFLFDDSPQKPLVRLVPVLDTYVTSADNSTSFSSSGQIEVGPVTSGNSAIGTRQLLARRIALVRFNASEILAQEPLCIPEFAQLVFYSDHDVSGNAIVYMNLDRPFTESVNYLNRPRPINANFFQSFDAVTALAGSPVKMVLDEQLHVPGKDAISVIERWQNDEESNRGILIDMSAADEELSFYSSEGAPTENEAPKMEISCIDLTTLDRDSDGTVDFEDGCKRSCCYLLVDQSTKLIYLQVRLTLRR